MAESLRGALDRIHPTGMSGPPNRVQRIVSATHAQIVLRLLPRGATDQAVFLQEDGTIVVFDYDSEGGGSSRINRFASSIEPSKVFIHGGSIPNTSPIRQVEAISGLTLGYVRLLQLFKARSRGNERQSLILAGLHRLFSGGRIIQEGIVAACHQVAGLTEPGFMIAACPHLFHSLHGAG